MNRPEIVQRLPAPRRGPASLWWIGLLCACAALAACQGGDAPSQGGYGAISVQAVWPDAAAAQGALSQPMTAPASVNSLSAVVLNGGTTVATGGPWLKTANTGSIDNILAGGPYTVKLFGYASFDGSGSPIFQGGSTPVTVVAGQTTPTGTIAMFDSHGGLDPTFNAPNGFVLSVPAGMTTAAARRIRKQADGKVLIVGCSSPDITVSSCNSGGSANMQMTLWRFNDDGTPDNTFNGGTVQARNYITHPGLGAPAGGFDVVQDGGSGKIYVVGDSTSPSTPDATCPSAGEKCMTLWGFNANGSVDSSFFDLSTVGAGPGTREFMAQAGLAGSASGQAIVLAGTSLYVAGQSTDNTPTPATVMALWAYSISLKGLDIGLCSAPPACPSPQGFITGGLGPSPAGGNALAFIPGSPAKLVIVGFGLVTFQQMLLWRWPIGGTDFDTLDGVSQKFLFDAAGQASATGNSIFLDASGNYVIAGNAPSSGSQKLTVWRYVAGTTPVRDGAFAGGSGYFSYTSPAGASFGNWVMTDASGNIVVSGASGGPPSTSAIVLRLTTAGVPDTTFNPTNGGYFTHTASLAAGGFDRSPGGFVFDSTGRILLSGIALNSSNTGEQMALWRINP